MKQFQDTSPSLFKLSSILLRLTTKAERITLASIGVMAMITSVLELITAGTVIVLVQFMQEPDSYIKRIPSYINVEIQNTSTLIIMMACLCAAIYTLKNIWVACETFYQHKNIQRMNWSFKVRMMQRYGRADYRAHISRNPAYSLSVVTSDIEIMFSNGFLPAALIMSEGIIFLSLIGLITYMTPGLVLVLGMMGILIAFLMIKFLMPLHYRWGQRFQAAGMNTLQHLNQFFMGFKDILLSGKQDKFIESYAQEAQSRAKIQSLYGAASNWPRLTIETTFIVLVCATIIILIKADYEPQTIITLMSAYLYAGFRLMPGLNRIINSLNALKGSTASILRVQQEWDNMPPEGHYQNIPALQFHKDITLNNVTFYYQDKTRAALENVSLTIRKGECIGIAGETGSGKSTLLDVIIGLLPPTTGQALIDHQYPAASLQWHHKIGYVPQTPSLSDDTIAANIAFGIPQDQIDMERVQQVLAEAQLKNLIKNAPEGLFTKVGDRGSNLSGGERQRIAIARALYHRPDVLIFDEATSALDTDTETRIMETINNVARHHTVIMVAHRLSTLQNCDRIIYMNNGHIARTEINRSQEVKSHDC